MPYQLSTWGKYEGLRKELQHSLLQDILINKEASLACIRRSRNTGSI